MSILKNRIRLQQARTQFDRGLISEEEFARIEIECSAGTIGHIDGEPGKGVQILDGNKLSPVATSRRRRSARASTAAAGSSPVPAEPATGENLGNV